MDKVPLILVLCPGVQLLALVVHVADHLPDMDKVAHGGEIPTAQQWVVLYQIEICLTSMAFWQRALEEEYYVTSSLVVLAVYMIRMGYSSTIMECVHT